MPAPSVIPLDEIPTLTELYKAGKLSPAPDASVSTNKAIVPPSDLNIAPSATLNDRVALIKADITKLHVDAIVNAANRSLMGGGGVDGAIHRAAGPDLASACAGLGGCEPGDAKSTGAFGLPCRLVVHTVGPNAANFPEWNRDARAQQKVPQEMQSLLSSCYTRSLEVAADADCASIAFSCISTGIYGYPSDPAAQVALKAIRSFLVRDDRIKMVIITTFVAADVRAYEQHLPLYFPAHVKASNLPS